jgi:Family of unknown function (DUF6551)
LAHRIRAEFRRWIEAQLAAAEIVRRAERGIGVAIRRGQQDGEIARPGDHRSHGSPGVHGGNPNDRHDDHLGSPGSFFRHGDERADTYAMTAGVSDADFENAIGEAKAEGNLSRANVVRKVRQQRRAPPAPEGHVPDPADNSPEAAAARIKLIGEFAARGMSSGQIGERLGIAGDQVRQLAREHGIGIPADAVLGRARRPDSARIERQARLRWVPLAQMRVNPLAQRDFNSARVAKLAAVFDPEKMDTPTVNHRGGWYYLIDGQHRIAALKQWLSSWQDQQVQCWTYEGLSEEQEAEKFLALNDTLPVRAFAKFKVSVQAGRDTEVDVDRIVRALGCGSPGAAAGSPPPPRCAVSTPGAAQRYCPARYGSSATPTARPDWTAR